MEVFKKVRNRRVSSPSSCVYARTPFGVPTQYHVTYHCIFILQLQHKTSRKAQYNIQFCYEAFYRTPNSHGIFFIFFWLHITPLIPKRLNEKEGNFSWRFICFNSNGKPFEFSQMYTRTSLRF
jgi:hypothetical protein